ncbi:MAG: polymerase, sigma-24 subunit, subfamily [Acidobacteria bacterium]|nr:polymerase, sigma-24 subunit, subfamily [Acidobacteriota bacterium]
MTTRGAADGRHAGWSDERLVRACLNGDDDAWAALIDRYRRLIYSIPVRYGASPEDAADIFQLVCLELFAHLRELRAAGALRGWIATVATHQSFHWKQKHRRRTDRELTNIDVDDLQIEPAAAADVVDAAVHEQMLKEAAARLSPRCQEMIQLLFYTDPPLPYKEVARRLGLAVGSIGFIRGRCLQHLAKTLKGMGF